MPRMLPEPSEVAAWMRESGRGYKAAAQHFGITIEEARALKAAAGKTAPAPRARARETTTPPPAADTREAYLLASLEQLERMTRDAEAAGSYTAAVQAKRAAMATRAELDQLRETQRRTEAPRTTQDHRAEVLSEVRRLRVGATEAGSYVAAARLLQLERELLDRDAAAQSEEEAEELARRTVDDLRAEIEALQQRRVKQL